MLKTFVRAADSSIAVVFRLAACLFFCLLSALAIVQSIRAEFPPQSDVNVRLEDEHRFSVLETKVDHLNEALDKNQTTQIIALIMLAGLAGERGLDLVKKKVLKQ